MRTESSTLLWRRFYRPAVLLSAISLPMFFLPALASQTHASGHTKERPYALIFGTVYGPDNRAAYGVRIKIRRANEKKAKWELYSDHRGEFAQRVPAGADDYIVWADVKTRNGAPPEARVHIENDERQDIGLHLTE